MERVDYQKLLVQDLINLKKRDEINLNPWYQRREVWKPPQKAYLVNTLFEAKPVPTIYVRHSIDIEKGKSIQEIVDGQQRCKAIIEYVEDDGFRALHPEHEKHVRYSELSKSQKQSFLLTALSVGSLLGATDEDVVEIFGRINSVSKTLNHQEKRNANFSGEFKQYCLKEAINRLGFWRNYGIFTSNDIARMQEVQFVSEISIGLMKGIQDQKQDQIDRYYREFDEGFPKGPAITRRLNKIFNTLTACDPDSIKNTVFSRQPLFYSLVMAIDVNSRIPPKRLTEKLWAINDRFELAEQGNGAKNDQNFYAASSTTTQRIKQRTTRHNYLLSALA